MNLTGSIIVHIRPPDDFQVSVDPPNTTVVTTPFNSPYTAIQASTSSISDVSLYTQAISSSVGPPTGSPVTQSGTVPVVYDIQNDMMYVFNGTWKSSSFA